MTEKDPSTHGAPRPGDARAAQDADVDDHDAPDTDVDARDAYTCSAADICSGHTDAEPAAPSLGQGRRQSDGSARATPARIDLVEAAQPPATTNGASDVAFAVAKLVGVIPRHSADDLRRLLARSLTFPTPSELRAARLGLLIDLVEYGQGVIPGVADYEQLRSHRAVAGETWPSHTTLLRAYGGHWVGAVQAAMRVAFEQPAVPVPSWGYAAGGPSYTRDEVAAALARCWLALDLHVDGPGPSLNEYLEWAITARRAARTRGMGDPRYPARLAVLRACGGWDRAIQLARRQLATSA